MANKKISEFVAAAAVGTSVVPVSDAAGTVTNKVTLASIAALGGGAPADNAVTTAKLLNSAVTYAKLQNVSVTDRLLGRATAGAGVVEEIPCTVLGRSVLAAATAAAARTALGLATVAATGNYSDLAGVPDPLLKTGGTITGNLIVNGAVVASGARSAFAANNEQYALGARYNASGGVVYFGATNATTTPDVAISNSGGATLMLLQSGGNVGIGTTAPTQKLHVNGNITATKSLAPFDVSARSYVREWIELPNFTGLLSTNNSAFFRPNDGSYGSWKFTGTRNGWAGIEFSDSNTSLMQSLDGNTTGFHRNGYGWQFYWQNGELRCFKTAFGGGTNAAVLDSVNYANYISESNKNVMHGRLGLIAGNPYSYNDTVASAALYYSPYLGNNLSLYDTVTNTWKAYSFSEVSIANTGLLANTNYDVFVFNNAGVTALELVPWASASARVTELTLLSGVYVKTGAFNRRYVGTVRTTAAIQFANSETQRFIWNMYNKRHVRMYIADAIAHTYASAGAVISRAWRNAPTTFLTEAVFGFETPIHASLTSSATPSTGAAFTHINEDVADTSITFQATVHAFMSTVTSDRSSSVEFTAPRPRGSHKYYPMERLNVSSSATYNNFHMSIAFEA